MLTVRWHGLKELVRDLRVAREKALPYAIRNGLNTAAFEARRMWQREIRESFTIRSPFTERSVLVQRATGTNVRGMHAVVGSVAPYMVKQEHGGVERGRGRHKAIPAPVAGGGAPGSKTRPGLIRSRFRLGAVQVAKARLKGNRAQRNAIAIETAKRKGKRAVMLGRPNGGVGLFALAGGRKKAKVRLLYDFSKSSVRVKPEPTLQRTLKAIGPKLPHIMAASVLEQLRRHRLLGY